MHEGGDGQSGWGQRGGENDDLQSEGRGKVAGKKKFQSSANRVHTVFKGKTGVRSPGGLLMTDEPEEVWLPTNPLYSAGQGSVDGPHEHCSPGWADCNTEVAEALVEEEEEVQAEMVHDEELIGEASDGDGSLAYKELVQGGL